MSREQIYEELNDIFRDVFDDDSIEVNDATVSDDIEGWDSLEHIDLCVAIERHFKFKFTMGEANKLKNVGEMVDIIMQRAR
jgi:acyl carrier protein